MTFKAGKYRDPESGRFRWAVLGPNNAWYFATRYGKTPAVTLAHRLNKEAR